SRSATPTVLRRDQADGSRRQLDAPEPERVDGRSASPGPGTAGVSNGESISAQHSGQLLGYLKTLLEA
ncbi:Hypothetical predicted protein, partial [Pelobates cultripes]